MVFYVRIDKPQATSTGAIYCTTTVSTQNDSDLLESPCFSFKHRKMFIEKLLMQLGASESLSHLTSQLKPSIILNACCKHEDTFERGQWILLYSGPNKTRPSHLVYYFYILRCSPTLKRPYSVLFKKFKVRLWTVFQPRWPHPTPQHSWIWNRGYIYGRLNSGRFIFNPPFSGLPPFPPFLFPSSSAMS